MSRNNTFFTDNRRKLFGEIFGYAIEYSITIEDGEPVLRFQPKMIASENVFGEQKIRKFDLVCECIFRLAQDAKKIKVVLYDRQLEFNSTESLSMIRTRVETLQKSLIPIDPKLNRTIQLQLYHGLDDLISKIDIF